MNQAIYDSLQKTAHEYNEANQTFKAVAYFKAIKALKIAFATEPIISVKGQLVNGKKIPGVGRGVAGRIGNILAQPSLPEIEASQKLGTTPEKLEDRYIHNLAKDKGVTIDKAIEMINHCIRQISTAHDLPFRRVYGEFFDADRLRVCLNEKTDCSKLSAEECTGSCKCVLYGNECISRVISDADIINRDPDAYVYNTGISTTELTSLVERASFLYYNYDGGGLSDNSFDALNYHLNKRLKIKGRRYEKIGAPPVEKIRTKLSYPMASLNKAKAGTFLLFSFLNKNKSPIVWSLKLDGSSGMVAYEGGKINGIYTRGDGIEGGDITYIKKYCKNFPMVSTEYPNIVVRGEFIISKNVWEEKYKGQYSTARGFVSGKLNQGYVSPAFPDIDFVAYSIIDIGDGTTPKHSDGLEILKKIGFNVVEYGLLSDERTMFEIMALYKAKREYAEYFIDGLVLTLNEPRDAEFRKLENPKHSVAFKMDLDSQIRETEVIDIDWRISRYGKYVPVAVYNAVYVDDARLHRATAYNAAHVRDWGLGKGSKIKIQRSGDVIPIIKDVEIDRSIEPLWPPLTYDWGWNEKETEIVLDEIGTNRYVIIKRIEHFFETVGVPRLREKTIEKLYDSGMDTLEAIIQAKPSDLIQIQGIGKKSAEMHYKNIHETMRKTRIDRFVVASTFFDAGLGRKMIKQLLREYPELIADSVKSDAEAIIKARFKKHKIKGFGIKRINDISKNMPRFMNYLFSLNKEDVMEAIKYTQGISTPKHNPAIKDKMFVLTGFMGNTDYILEDWIYDYGGEFGRAVSSSTSAVISANLFIVSDKMERAHELSVPVYSVEEFVKKYNIPHPKAALE